MSWRDDIKNKITQIEDNEITISNEFPNKDNCFVDNNPEVLIDKETGESYITGKTNKGTYYSSWSFEEWK